jgi:predicted ATP-grasp superfamily ATP-dependent carboligase
VAIWAYFGVFKVVPMAKPLPFDPSRLSRSRPPVILLGGTNLVRALGLADLPVIVASSDPDEPALASRYALAAVVLPPLSHPEAVVDALLELSAGIFRAIGCRVPLMYGNDGYLEFIYACRDRLNGHFLLTLNDHKVAHALIEKSRFAEFAAERGLPVPLTLRWEGGGVQDLRNWSRPVVVKPRAKTEWHDSPLHEHVFTDDSKALVFDNGPAAMAHPLVERYRNQLTFQEFIPGDDSSLWSFHGYADENGHVLAAFVGRKIRTYPPITGESAYIEMVQDPGLLTFGRIMAGRIPLRGPFKIDFKKDAVDGRLVILEVNARYTLWHYLGAANGLNLTRVAYDHLVHGLRPERAYEYRTTHRWLYLGYDFLAYRSLAKRGELNLFGWLRSLAAPKIYNVFAWTDPWPLAALWVGRLTRRSRRATGKFLTLVRQWRSTAS